MKYSILILFFSLLLFSCEKEEETNIPPLPSGSTPFIKPVDTTSNSTPLAVSNDTILAIEEFDNSYYGTYKGVLVNGKTESGYFLLHTFEDSSQVAYINVNNTTFETSNITVKSSGLNIDIRINDSGYNLSLTTSKTGLIQSKSLLINAQAFNFSVLKEKSDNEVRVYKGVWESEVITPISRFTEEGLWNLAVNNTLIKGANGEAGIIGDNDSQKLSGKHNDGTFTGTQFEKNCSGTFNWSAFGVSGVGNWNSEQVFIKNLFTI